MRATRELFSAGHRQGSTASRAWRRGGRRPL